MGIDANVTSSQVVAAVTEGGVSVDVAGGSVSVDVSGGVGPTGPQGPSGSSALPSGTEGYVLTYVGGTWTAAAPSGAVSSVAGKTGTVTLVVADVSGLQTALDGKQAAGSYAAATHSHTWSDITNGKPTTLSGYGITDAVASNDSRLTDSREWSASTITQAEAEAGTATTRRAFTAERVWQSIAAYLADATQAAKTAFFGGTNASGAIVTATSSNGNNVYLGRYGANVDGLWSDSGSLPRVVNVIGGTLTNFSFGNIASDGKLGTTANVPLITGTGGTIVAGAFGTSANTFCQGNDTRLSDSRTPTSHTHGNITNAGAIGSTSGQIVVTTTSGVLTTATIGSGLTLSGGTLTASGGGGSSTGSDLYLWATFR